MLQVCHHVMLHYHSFSSSSRRSIVSPKLLDDAPSIYFIHPNVTWVDHHSLALHLYDHLFVLHLSPLCSISLFFMLPRCRSRIRIHSTRSLPFHISASPGSKFDVLTASLRFRALNCSSCRQVV